MTTIKGGADFTIDGQYQNPIVDPTNDPTPPPTNDPGGSDPLTDPPLTGGGADNLFTEENAVALGGVRFDQNGNLLNDKGVIMRTVTKVKGDLEELVKNKGTDPGNNDDGEGDEDLQINEAGDLVNSKGETVRAKGSFTFDEKTGLVTFVDQPLVETLSEHFRNKGFQLVDEDNKPVAFPDTEEGILTLVETLAAEQYRAVQQQEFEQFPEVARLKRHLAEGGDAASFYRERSNVTDYAKINHPIEDQAGRVNLIRDYLTKVNKLQGEDLDQMIDLIKTKGEVDQRYTRYLTELRTNQANEIESERKAMEQAQREAEDSNRQYWEGVQETIRKGVLGEISIPEKERAQFFEFLYTPVKGNMSAFQIAMQELPLDKLLALQFQVYKGGNLDDLVRVKAKQEQANDLRTRLASGKKQIAVTKAPGLRNNSGDPLNIPSFSNIV